MVTIHLAVQCRDHHKEVQGLQETIHLEIQVVRCHVRHNDQFVRANNHVPVGVQVDLADNVQVLQRVQEDKVDLDFQAEQDQDLLRVLKVVKVAQVDHVLVEIQDLLIVQVETLVVHQVVHQVVKVDSTDQDNAQDLVVAEILQVHSVKVDQRRVTRRRARKRYAMTLKICRLHHLAA